MDVFLIILTVVKNIQSANQRAITLLKICCEEVKNSNIEKYKKYVWLFLFLDIVWIVV